MNNPNIPFNGNKDSVLTTNGQQPFSYTPFDNNYSPNNPNSSNSFGNGYATQSPYLHNPFGGSQIFGSPFGDGQFGGGLGGLGGFNPFGWGNGGFNPFGFGGFGSPYNNSFIGGFGGTHAQFNPSYYGMSREQYQGQNMPTHQPPVDKSGYMGGALPWLNNPAYGGNPYQGGNTGINPNGNFYQRPGGFYDNFGQPFGLAQFSDFNPFGNFSNYSPFLW